MNVTFEGGPLDRQTLNIADGLTTYRAKPKPRTQRKPSKSAKPTNDKAPVVEYMIVKRWQGASFHWVGILA